MLIVQIWQFRRSNLILKIYPSRTTFKDHSVGKENTRVLLKNERATDEQDQNLLHKIPKLTGLCKSAKSSKKNEETRDIYNNVDTEIECAEVRHLAEDCGSANGCSTEHFMTFLQQVSLRRITLPGCSWYVG